MRREKYIPGSSIGFCTALAACALLSASACVADSDQPGVILEEFIYESAAFPSVHASTILELPSGELLAAFFGGTAEGDPDVEIWLSRKPPAGAWSAPFSVADGKRADGSRTPTWNPVLFRERESGTVYLFYKDLDSPSTWRGMVKTSDDDGNTWSAGEPIGDGLIGPVKNKPVQLDDGTIVAGSSTEHDGWRVHVERSTDGGKSWTKGQPLNDGENPGAIQPTLMQLGDGRLLMYCRTWTDHGFIARSESSDKGKSWSPLEPASLPNNNSGFDAVTLDDGRQLLVYNHSTRTQEKMGHKGRGIINVALSNDGETWNAALILDYLDEPGRQFSYPAVIQTSDGLVHIVYTWHRERIKHVVLDPEKLETTPMPDGQWPARGRASLENFLEQQ